MITTYEIALYEAGHEDKPSLVSYANKTPSQARLIRAVRNRYDMLQAVTGAKEWHIGNAKAPGYLFSTGGRWRIQYTGRTAYQSSASELPWIGDTVNTMALLARAN